MVREGKTKRGMLDRSTKEGRNLEISLGLLTGYCVAALIYKFTFDKSWGEAFSNEKLILGIAGIGLSLFIIAWRKRKTEDGD